MLSLFLLAKELSITTSLMGKGLAIIPKLGAFHIITLRVGTKEIFKVISSIIIIFPITKINMHIIIKIIFNSTYRLIFKIIMNAIKLTILHKFLSVRIKIDARNMLRPGCYPFFFLPALLPPPLLFLLLHLRKEWLEGKFLHISWFIIRNNRGNLGETLLFISRNIRDIFIIW